MSETLVRWGMTNKPHSEPDADQRGGRSDYDADDTRKPPRHHSSHDAPMRTPPRQHGSHDAPTKPGRRPGC